MKPADIVRRRLKQQAQATVDPQAQSKWSASVLARWVAQRVR